MDSGLNELVAGVFFRPLFPSLKKSVITLTFTPAMLSQNNESLNQEFEKYPADFICVAAIQFATCPAVITIVSVSDLAILFIFLFQASVTSNAA